MARSKPGRLDYLKIAVMGFGLTALSQSLHTLILPARLTDLVPDESKNTYLGLITFSGLLIAMVTQPVIGTLSDHSASSWGRRRPFILAGSTLVLLLLPTVGLWGSYWALFATYCLIQLNANVAQGPYQGFIPDIIPEERRGRASAAKALAETAGGAIAVLLVGSTIDHYILGQGNVYLYLTLLIPWAMLLLAALVTIFTVREPPVSNPERISLAEAFSRSFKIEAKLRSSFLFFLVSRLLVFMAFTTLQRFAFYYLGDVLEVPQPASATAQFTVTAVAGLLLAIYPAGLLSDKVGRKALSIASAFTGAIGVGLIILFKDYTAALVAAGIIGLGIGGFSSANWALATELIAPHEEAKYLGITNMATAAAGALASLIGPVIDYFNRQGENLGYSIMLVACLLYLLIGGLLLLRIRPKD